MQKVATVGMAILFLCGACGVDDSDRETSTLGETAIGGLCRFGGPLARVTVRNLGDLPVGAAPTTLALAGSDVLVGTQNGVWSRALSGSADWQPIGLQGSAINTLWVSPSNPALILAGLPSTGKANGGFTLYRSTDRGVTWTGVSEGIKTTEDVAITVSQIVSQTVGTNQVLYANMTGGSVARSMDEGLSWTYVRGKPLLYMNYECPLLVPTPSAGKQWLYEGCEAPLDVAWIEKYDISDATQKELAEGTRLVGHDQIGNRRPNSFAISAARPNRIYAGLEGGLIWIEGAMWGWVFMANGDNLHRYTYVEAIWTDPCDANHLEFGGGEQGSSPDLSLYETYLGGLDAKLVADRPKDLDEPRLVRGMAIGERGKDFLFAVSYGPDDAKKGRVFVREHSR